MKGAYRQEQTDRLRAVALPRVLRLLGAQVDRHDPRKWHTPRGSLSIQGAKFMNWTQGVGGGGAIDLVMHLQGAGFTEARQWLACHFPDSPAAPNAPDLACRQNGPLRLPARQPRHLERVRDYLIIQRALPAGLIDRLIASDCLYADPHANAVFVLLAKANQPVGAELRGTGPTPWRGMAPGSRKDQGFFAVPEPWRQATDTASSAGIILCESAIDAISCLVLHPDHPCISTAGARPNPHWLPDLVASDLPLYCGFDADPTGEAMATAMISLHPSITRLRPPHHDWNDTLRSRR